MTPPQPRHKAVSRGRHLDSTPPPTVLYSHMSLRVTSSGTILWRAISRSSINLPADRPRTAIRLPSPPQQFKIPGAGKKKQCNNSLSLSSRDIPRVYHPPRSRAYIYPMASFRRASWSQHPKSDKIIAKNIKNMLLSRSIPSLPSTLRRVESGAAKQSKKQKQKQIQIKLSINTKHYQVRRANAFPYQIKTKNSHQHQAF